MEVPLASQVLDAPFLTVSNSSDGHSDLDSAWLGLTDTVLEFVPEYHRCQAQIGTKFECVPLAPIYVCKGQPKIWDLVQDIFTAHKLIRESGIPNFLGLRIPVCINTNVSSWRKHLADYFDQQLLDLIEFGFPLDFDRTRNLQSTLINHASSRLYPDHVDKYIQEEVGFEAMLGPLNAKPFNIHISPFMIREKSDSNSRRTIMDLSFPKVYQLIMSFSIIHIWVPPSQCITHQWIPLLLLLLGIYRALFLTNSSECFTVD